MKVALKETAILQELGRDAYADHVAHLLRVLAADPRRRLEARVDVALSLLLTGDPGEARGEWAKPHAWRGARVECGLKLLPRRSPFLTAVMQASNYRGEFVGVPAEIEGGSWLYDRLRNELVYVPNLKRYLVADPDDLDAAHLRFRLEVLKASTQSLVGVAIRPVTAFRWNPA